MTSRADVVGALTGFARALRAAGVNADRTRLTTALAALGEIDPGRADDVYWAARLALCSEPDDLPRFDALFDMWFRGARPNVPGTERAGAAARAQPGRRALARATPAPARTRPTTTCCAPPRARPRSCATATSPS